MKTCFSADPITFLPKTFNMYERGDIIRMVKDDGPFKIGELYEVAADQTNMCVVIWHKGERRLIYQFDCVYESTQLELPFDLR